MGVPGAAVRVQQSPFHCTQTPDYKYPITVQLQPITDQSPIPISHTGVAAWDVRTGACVSASPGSHAGAVTVVLAATGPGLGGPEQVGTNPSNSSSNSLNPALVLTASSAPGDGRVRLWDVRTGPRETAAASPPSVLPQTVKPEAVGLSSPVSFYCNSRIEKGD